MIFLTFVFFFFILKINIKFKISSSKIYKINKKFISKIKITNKKNVIHDQNFIIHYQDEKIYFRTYKLSLKQIKVKNE
jgi:hypothetical protein